MTTDPGSKLASQRGRPSAQGRTWRPDHRDRARLVLRCWQRATLRPGDLNRPGLQPGCSHCRGISCWALAGHSAARPICHQSAPIRPPHAVLSIPGQPDWSAVWIPVVGPIIAASRAGRHRSEVKGSEAPAVPCSRGSSVRGVQSSLVRGNQVLARTFGIGTLRTMEPGILRTSGTLEPWNPEP